MTGIMIAAPQSGSGKTTVTLGLLRALKRRGVALAPGKAGPDYIDPAFHAAASGETCLNYDPWAMRGDLLLANASLQSQGGRMLVIEAMMGLFDGAADGSGSAGDLAGLLGLPVILVIDCARMSHSVAALAHGFAHFHPDVLMPGVILNRVASVRHEGMLRQALEKARIEVIGALPMVEKLSLPARHLGLVQAGENTELAALIDSAADLVESRIDLNMLIKLAQRAQPKAAPANIPRLPPPGQKIAVARDIAFAFAYEHMLLGWQRRGAEISFFSPLNNEAPADGCDAVVLPGGYPELHAGT
ncbi:MAG: cobyrinate a,c-diamide synthase, partial [Hoeflea sp.]|nr:cobyrinate a,c-diamide synthase [Hoeflea sp.]